MPETLINIISAWSRRITLLLINIRGCRDKVFGECSLACPCVPFCSLACPFSFIFCLCGTQRQLRWRWVFLQKKRGAKFALQVQTRTCQKQFCHQSGATSRPLLMSNTSITLPMLWRILILGWNSEMSEMAPGTGGTPPFWAGRWPEMEFERKCCCKITLQLISAFCDLLQVLEQRVQAEEVALGGETRDAVRAWGICSY